VPVVVTEKSVILAASAPLSSPAIEEIKERLGNKDLSVVLASPSFVSQTLAHLSEQHTSSFPRLGEKLLSLGLINEEQLIEALRAQKYYPQPLGQILVEMGVITQENLEKVLEEN
jgi:hypothetical protein